MSDDSSGWKVGDRVSTASGIVGRIVEPPAYHDRAKGDPFTGWAVVVEADEPSGVTLARVERGLSSGSRHIVHVDRLTDAYE